MSSLLGQVLVGDALAVLKTLPDGLADCVVTSPPYFGLRDYGVAGQLGQEPDVETYAASLQAVVTECRRVLAPYGSLWLNLADAFARTSGDGAGRGSLLLAPERVARALVADGWLLRNKVIWAKSNPLPSSVRDRLNTTHEFVYFFARERNYFFDLDAIRVPAVTPPRASRRRQGTTGMGRLAGRRDGLARLAAEGRSAHPLGKNPGDVWQLGSSADRSGHVAPFPAGLVRRPILAACPEKVCTACGQPWRRSVRRPRLNGGVAQPRPLVPCGCDAPTRPGVVLDPFMGAGTTARVARELDRDWLGIELNPAYAELARTRLATLEPHAGRAA